MEKVYTHAQFPSCRIDRRVEVMDEYLETTGYDNIDGVLVHFDRAYKILPKLPELFQKIKNKNKDLIIGFRAATPGLPRYAASLRFIHEMKDYTDKMAMTNPRYSEWRGRRNLAREYQNMAEKNNIQWVSTFTHQALCADLSTRRQRLRDFFIKNNISCICLCGYILAGYLYDDLLIPHLLATDLKQRNLYKEFGLTIEKLQEYLEPLDMISGAGAETGLATGTRQYAKKLNFKGIICSPPFDIRVSEDVKIYESPPKEPPLSCGPLDTKTEGAYNLEYKMRRQKGINAKNKIISFAFDNAILANREKYYTWNIIEPPPQYIKTSRPNPFITRIIREYYREGYDIVIVTSRNENDEILRRYESINFWRQDYPQPIKNVYFTVGKLKGRLLHKIGSVLHYDNNPEQRESAEKYGIKTAQPIPPSNITKPSTLNAPSTN